jgi:DNA-binding response OmpR family regulator
VALVPDLFFASRLESLAERHGASVAVARTVDELAKLVADTQPELVLVDLGIRGLDVGAAIRAVRGAGSPRLIAFGPHKDLAAREAALAAGADRWVTNQRLLETVSEELRSL